MIYFSSWLQNTSDLDLYPQTVLILEQPRNPSNVKFPNSSDNKIYEIESKNVATVGTGVRSYSDEDESDFDGPENNIYNPIKFCKRIINSIQVSPSRYDVGLTSQIKKVETVNILEGQELALPRDFFSSTPHYDS
uniref:Uncharacterized protein n=1 Tax=Eucampia antarctica TaxID=49252 RepID=A0A7S2W633_9STRA|mmetsp:Transcript_21091/g.20263  ORF Transcript_21091/g.20263 Transcript_21091/m.20263 type:complete len:135 (+) Transcript_21091:297-701(+)